MEIALWLPCPRPSQGGKRGCFSFPVTQLLDVKAVLGPWPTAERAAKILQKDTWRVFWQSGGGFDLGDFLAS